MVLFSLAICVTSECAYIYANENISCIDEAKPARIEDVIVYKYKWMNGIKYKRRWNESKEIWVDDYWIPCS